MLQHSGTEVDILAARRDDAIEHLDELIHAYRRTAPAMNNASARTHQMTTSAATAPAASVSPLAARPPATTTTTPSRAASRR